MASTEASTSPPIDPEIESKIRWSVEETAKLFAATKPSNSFLDFPPSKKIRLSTKLQDTYLNLPETLLAPPRESGDPELSTGATANDPHPKGVREQEEEEKEQEPTANVVADKSKTKSDNQLIDDVALEIQLQQQQQQQQHHQARSSVGSSAVVEYRKAQAQSATAQRFGAGSVGAIVRRRASQVPKPKWHAPWKLKRVISGHLGWVRAVAMDPTNDWFVTGSADRTIKLWDLASGQLKLTLTGHINSIRGLEVSARHPYLFSAAEDKKVLCWDLEYNKVIRSYHGHLSGVFSLKLHPTLDILVTGGRDAVARVWDMRSKNQIHCLGGHEGTVWAMETQATDPQIITGSSDSTVKLWDLAAGKVMTTLTNHKKSVRALAKSPIDHSFVSGAADNLKKWEAKDGRFLRNFSGHNAVINSLAINQDGVLISSADNGSMRFWDYQTGYCFQSEVTKVQPGSLDSEAGIYASTFDKTGLRFITCEADKTIKVWQEDASATEESHPIDMAGWTKEYTAPKRY